MCFLLLDTGGDVKHSNEVRAERTDMFIYYNCQKY